MSVLRPDQVLLDVAIDAAIEDGTARIVAQAPTGFGKTIVAAQRLKLLQDTGRRGLMIVPALSLIDQTVTKLYAEGVDDVGVIQAAHPMTNPRRLIQVATAQTLQRRDIPSADEVLIDEAHIVFKALYRRLFSDERLLGKPIIGLTATPWTRGLGRYFEKLIVGSTTARLIEDGTLAPFRAFAPASPDLRGVRTVAGDYHEGDLASVMNRGNLVADVVDTWIDLARGRPTLCFAVDRAHAKNLQRSFAAAGVPAGYVDAYTTAAERAKIARSFNAGKIRVVCNVGCLTVGIDWDVRCIILARPTKSEMLYVQMIGRGLRTAPGKPDCLILDHSDNTTRLGFVTEIHHDELDDGKPRPRPIQRRERLPKICPKCSFLRPPKIAQCPACGFLPEPQCDVVNEDGELVEVTACNVAKPDDERVTFYAELRTIAQRRNYKDGWVGHKFRERYGAFPPWSYHQLEPIEPSEATLRWVKSRQIAWLHRRTDEARP